MPDFINTIDVLGDDAVIDSIIDRSIPEFKDNTLTSIGRCAFNCCAALKTADLPNVTTFTSDQNTDQCGFASCTALEEVNLPSLKTIEGTRAFQKTTSLKYVNLPAAESIGYGYCFQYGGVREAVLPVVTSLGNGDFQSCPLEKIDLSAVTSIGGSFELCKSFVALIIRTPSVCTLTVNWGFKDTPIKIGTGYIYVPRALVDSYKVATNWSDMATQFRALEDYTVDGTTTGALDETKIQ